MRGFLKILKTWAEELFGIPLAITLFLVSPHVLRWYDPTSGSYDAGVLQTILFASIQLLVFNAMVWIGMRILFPEVFKYFQNGFETDFTTLKKWQKQKLSLFIFFAFLFALALLSRVL